MTQNFIIYTDRNENVKLEVFIKDETIWATQKQMAELFGVDRSVISRHLKNIFETGELDENVVCANYALTTKHGAIEGKIQTKQVKYYNLDAIIAVGYRVNSKREGIVFYRKSAEKMPNSAEKMPNSKEVIMF